MGTGATCDAERFHDNSDGTVSDNLTGLRWEQKNDDGSIHDKDNAYQWSSSGLAADGGAFTGLVASLNVACLGGQCDWRVPTIAELQTITPIPCSEDPCIDPIFGPTGSGFYWSSTEEPANPSAAWGVLFNDGVVTVRGKGGANPVRAVRGGL